MMVYAEVSREGLTKTYLNYYEWPLTVFKGLALTSEQIGTFKQIALNNGKGSPKIKKQATDVFPYHTLPTS